MGGDHGGEETSDNGETCGQRVTVNKWVLAGGMGYDKSPKVFT